MLNTEIRNKTVGIIGLGTIGTRIAELCDNLGMNVIYWSFLIYLLVFILEIIYNDK